MEFSHVLCHGDSTGEASLFVDGARGNAKVIWSQDSLETGTTVSGLPAGDYFVRIEDENHCSITLDFTITQPEKLEVEIDVTHQSHKDSTDGRILVKAVGSAGEPTFQWAHGAQGALIQNLQPGSYTVSVNDENNCVAEETIIVEGVEHCRMDLDAEILPADCNDNLGSIKLKLKNDLDIATVRWMHDSSLHDMSAYRLVSGEYTVAIDDGRCSTIETFFVPLQQQIKVYPNPAHDFLTIDVPDCKKHYSVTFFDGIGRKVHQEMVERQRILKLSSAFIPGTYTLVFRADGEAQSRKLVIR